MKVFLLILDITEGEVEQELLKIDPTESTGISDLSPKVIRQIAPLIKKPVTSIFNKSFTTGIIILINFEDFTGNTSV